MVLPRAMGGKGGRDARGVQVRAPHVRTFGSSKKQSSTHTPTQPRAAALEIAGSASL